MKNIMRFLSFYSAYRWHVVLGISLSFVAVLSGIILLSVSGWFITAMGIAGVASITLNYFTPAAMIRGLSILRTTSRYGERLVNHDAALRVTSTFRAWFFNRLQSLPPSRINDLHSGDIFTRMRSDIDILEKFYLNGFVPLCTAVISILLLGLWIFVHYPLLAVVEIALLITVGFAVPNFMLARAKKYESLIAHEQSQLNINLAETMHGMTDYIIYGQIHFKKDRINQHSKKIDQARRILNAQECVVQAVLFLAGGLAVTAAIYFFPISNDEVFYNARLPMIALLCLAGFDIIVPLPAAIQSFGAARQAVTRIDEITDKAMPEDNKMASAIELQVKKHHLHVDHISFSYQGKMVLNDVSFDIAPGDVIVVAGQSGAGKSTLLNILLGILQPSKGDIFTNNVNINSFNIEDRHSLFSAVTQKPYLFADTLRANIVLAKPNATDQEIARACDISGLSQVIETLPHDLESYVGEQGACLSGGQIRRVALARAILWDAPILLLDEPTEGLDHHLECTVMQNILAHAKKHHTSVILCLHEPNKSWLTGDEKIISL